MKRYEGLSKEQIIDMFTGFCCTCDKDLSKYCSKINDNRKTCVDVVQQYLRCEVSKK